MLLLCLNQNSILLGLCFDTSSNFDGARGSSWRIESWTNVEISDDQGPTIPTVLYLMTSHRPYCSQKEEGRVFLLFWGKREVQGLPRSGNAGCGRWYFSFKWWWYNFGRACMWSRLLIGGAWDVPQASVGRGADEAQWAKAVGHQKLACASRDKRGRQVKLGFLVEGAHARSGKDWERRWTQLQFHCK